MLRKFLNLKISFIVSLLLAFLAASGLGNSWAGLKNIDQPPEEGGGTKESPIPLLSQISTINDAYGTGYVLDMQLVGNTLFTANIYGDPVFDVSNPQEPFKLDEIEHRNSTEHNAIKVVNNKYYAVGTALDVWELPSLTYMGTSDTWIANQIGLDVSGNRAYTISEGDGGPWYGNNGVLWIWDISNPQNISKMGSISLSNYSNQPFPPHPHNVIVVKKLAFIGMEGFIDVNIGNPANPTILARLDARGPDYFNHYPPRRTVHKRDDMEMAEDRIYKAQMSLGILVINLSFPNCPILEGIIGSPQITLGDIIAFEVSGNKAFVATKADKQFKVLDITDIRYPNVLAAVDISDIFNDLSDPYLQTYEVEIDTNRGLAFVAGERLLDIFDISAFLP